MHKLIIAILFFLPVALVAQRNPCSARAGNIPLIVSPHRAGDGTTTVAQWSQFADVIACVDSLGRMEFTNPVEFDKRILFAIPDGTPPFTIASTTPVANLQVSAHMLVTCGATAACSNTVVQNSIHRIGIIPLVAGTVALTGLPFTNTNTVCTATDRTAAAPAVAPRCLVTGTGSTMTCTGTTTDVIGYDCWGS